MTSVRATWVSRMTVATERLPVCVNVLQAVWATLVIVAVTSMASEAVRLQQCEPSAASMISCALRVSG